MTNQCSNQICPIPKHISYSHVNPNRHFLPLKLYIIKCQSSYRSWTAEKDIIFIAEKIIAVIVCKCILKFAHQQPWVPF